MGTLLALRLGKETWRKHWLAFKRHISNKEKRSLRVCSDARTPAWVETFSPAIPSPAHFTTARPFHASAFPFSALKITGFTWTIKRAEY